MIVNIGNVCFERMIVKRSVEIFDSFLKLFIFVESQPSFIENSGIVLFGAQCNGEIFNSFRILLNININIASLYEKVFVFSVSL